MLRSHPYRLVWLLFALSRMLLVNCGGFSAVLAGWPPSTGSIWQCMARLGFGFFGRLSALYGLRRIEALCSWPWVSRAYVFFGLCCASALSGVRQRDQFGVAKISDTYGHLVSQSGPHTDDIKPRCGSGRDAFR